MASKPAHFNSGAHQPPPSASANPPVNGDFAATVKRLAPGTGVPVIALQANTSILSGPNGSTPFFSSFNKK